ncbi:hypothetical protein LY90DRAFT_502223 [Neocallimastix californiae]|uniref:Uncharacterized protein n=1 Tax=Neocallimastix californiae TaxID=1754190 RepID=A0A1Y2EWL1_9FUNG|nr:hypothetical protein LY90DRAFT_502223 [Neocallimastix californiae]|eukprot:ORY75215.1 hypothetical protein LY90DRAFT_502223 [Neocallimastix californiae]
MISDNNKHSLESNIKQEQTDLNKTTFKKTKLSYEDIIKTRTLWTRQFQPYSINTLEVGKVLLKKKSEMGIIIGIDSTLRIIQNRDPIDDIPVTTSSGTILCIKLFPIMPTSSENNVNDIVIGDENGDVSLISNNQVFLKHNFGSPITNIEITKDMTNKVEIIASDFSGIIHSFNSYNINWKTRILDTNNSNSTLNLPTINPINCILPIKIKDKFNIDTSYLIVSNDTSKLYFYQLGYKKFEINVPFTINTICTGHISSKDTKDILLYLLIELNDYVNKMKTITIPCISKEQDVIICSGQFNGLKFFYNKNLIYTFNTTDWIYDFNFYTINSNTIRMITVSVEGELQVSELIISSFMN